LALRTGQNGQTRFFQKKKSFGPSKGSLPEKNLPWGTKGKFLKKKNIFFGKIWFGHFDQCAMPIGKMVSLFILPIGNPKRVTLSASISDKVVPFFGKIRFYSEVQIEEST
jgi:hypothetical protein